MSCSYCSNAINLINIAPPFTLTEDERLFQNLILEAKETIHNVFHRRSIANTGCFHPITTLSQSVLDFLTIQKDCHGPILVAMTINSPTILEALHTSGPITPHLRKEFERRRNYCKWELNELVELITSSKGFDPRVLVDQSEFFLVENIATSFLSRELQQGLLHSEKTPVDCLLSFFEKPDLNECRIS